MRSSRYDSVTGLNSVVLRHAFVVSEISTAHILVSLFVAGRLQKHSISMVALE